MKLYICIYIPITDIALDFLLSVNVYQSDLDTNVLRNLDSAETLKQETGSASARIEVLLADLEEKMARVESHLITLQQPVGFDYDSYQALDNPSGDLRPLMFNEVRIDFRYSTPTAQGLLFFVENSQTSEVIAIQIVEQRLMFIFNNQDEVLRIVSPADLCQGCWFRVIASR